MSLSFKQHMGPLLVFLPVLGGGALVGCGKSEPARTVEQSRSTEALSFQETELTERIDDVPKSELYSTLAGRMARMEELLNAIDRLLEDPDFQGRLVRDAEEFHELLIECRGLYPETLAAQDRPAFDSTIDRTAAAAKLLVRSLRVGDDEASRQTFIQLDAYRRNAHTRYSY